LNAIAILVCLLTLYFPVIFLTLSSSWFYDFF